MVLRKPYAFLIKYFKIIHLFVLLSSIFIITKLDIVSDFFSNYVASGYTATVTSESSKSFASFPVFTLIILNILVISAVAFLLNHKGKKQKFYYILIGMNIFLMCYIMYFAGVFKFLVTGLLEPETARIYRDLTSIIKILQYPVIVILGIRSLGFNVKQFNFNSDIKELDIKSSDNEEVEVNVNFDTFKAERQIRRFIREFKYYIKENLVIFLIILFGLTIYTGYNIITGISYYNDYHYSIRETFYAKNFYFTVNEAEISNVDLGGNEILEGKYFLLLNVTIKNETSNNISVDQNNYPIFIGDERIVPSLEYSSSFSDYGSTLIYKTIKNNSEKSYVFPYIIDESEINKTFQLKVYTSENINNGISTPIYTIVKFKADSIMDSVLKESEVTMPSELKFSNSAAGSTTIQIDDYKIGSSHTYTSQSCYYESCTDFQSVVYTSLTGSDANKTLLVLYSDLELDSTTTYYINNKSKNNFINNFIKVEYEYNGEIKQGNAEAATDLDVDGELIMKIPSYATNSETLVLVITIRNREYRYILK